VISKREDQSRIHANLNHFQIENHTNGSADFVFESMHFKAHAFEDDFRSGSGRDLLKEAVHLGRIEGGGW
jgi:hypothetical protein